MEQVGQVIKTNQGNAVVAVKRTSACGGNCGSCGGCKDSGVSVTVENELGAKPGDLVVLAMGSKSVLRAAFLVYLLPLILMLCAYLVADEVWHMPGFSALCGVGVLLASFVLLRISDRRRLASGRYRVRMIRVVGNEDGEQ